MTRPAMSAHLIPRQQIVLADAPTPQWPKDGLRSKSPPFAAPLANGRLFAHLRTSAAASSYGRNPPIAAVGRGIAWRHAVWQK